MANQGTYREGNITEQVEDKTAKIPSTVFLAAVGVYGYITGIKAG